MDTEIAQRETVRQVDECRLTIAIYVHRWLAVSRTASLAVSPTATLSVTQVIRQAIWLAGSTSIVRPSHMI